jgi:HAD superfamily hydrolase (TIGR01509 family)
MTTDLHALALVVDQTRWLLLDFDGPVCNLFAGLPAASVAARLRDLLAAEGAQLPASVLDSEDPIQVLRSTASLDPALSARIESALRAAELTASSTAKPTPHAREAILACHATNRAVAVVSNNSQAVVDAYLRTHQLDHHIDVAVGRTQPDPALLKPSPYLVVRAIQALDADRDACTFVGDNPADVQSAHAAGIRSIGYANKPGKLDHLTRASADAVITTMADLATALLTRRSPAPTRPGAQGTRDHDE